MMTAVDDVSLDELCHVYVQCETIGVEYVGITVRSYEWQRGEEVHERQGYLRQSWPTKVTKPGSAASAQVVSRCFMILTGCFIIDIPLAYLFSIQSTARASRR